MSKAADNLKDTGLERAIIGSIIKYGRDVFIDVSDIINHKDFSLPINQHIFKCIVDLSQEHTSNTFDTESIKAKARIIGIGEILESRTANEYLTLVSEGTFDQSRVRSFALQLKKLSIAREIHDGCQNTIGYLENVSGSEPLSEIIAHAEGNITEYINGLDSFDGLCHIGEDLEDKIRDLLSTQIKAQVGISSGFPVWDNGIGGGLRPGTNNVIGARPKTGKSYLSANLCLNIAKQGYPVLYLDSEMTKNYQQNRIICIEANCPMIKFETGQFQLDKDLSKEVIAASQRLIGMNFTYSSIGGKSPEEIINIIRRWVVNNVGFGENGLANPCVIIYDYLKLTSSDGLSGHTPEHIILGLTMTKLQNFIVKYGVSLVTFVQLNRDGISIEDTSVVAGSDRILWLCDSMTLLKNKDQADFDIGCTEKFGNKKLVILETRQGPGHDADDYINIFASIRPGVPQVEATGKFYEGKRLQQVKANGEIGS